MLQDAAMKSMSTVRDERKSVCMVIDMKVRDLLEAHEDVAGVSPEKT